MFAFQIRNRYRLLRNLPQSEDLQDFLNLLPENDRPKHLDLNQELDNWVKSSLYGK